jgi:hypothetical protein
MKTLEYKSTIDVTGVITRFFQNSPKRDSWSIIKKLIVSASKLYEAKYGRPMCLSLIHRIVMAKEDSKFLENLQDFAKDCADMGTLRIVFISSDSALPLLMSRSAWSREKKPPTPL